MGGVWNTHHPVIIDDSGEKNPQQGGVNEVKRGGGMWVIRRHHF